MCCVIRHSWKIPFIMGLPTYHTVAPPNRPFCVLVGGQTDGFGTRNWKRASLVRCTSTTGYGSVRGQGSARLETTISVRMSIQARRRNATKSALESCQEDTGPNGPLQYVGIHRRTHVESCCSVSLEKHSATPSPIKFVSAENFCFQSSPVASTSSSLHHAGTFPRIMSQSRR